MASLFSFEAIGTHWNIHIYEDISFERETEILALIKERIEVFNKTYSRFRNDSWLYQLSLEKGLYSLPEDAPTLFCLYKELYDLSGGLVTPFIGQTLVDAGYDKEYSFTQKKELELPPMWNDVLEYNPPNITMKLPTMLDFGAIGKGYVIDIVANLLEERKIHSYCVEAGGDMIHRTEEKTEEGKEKMLRIGLEHPEDPTQVIGAFSLGNQAIAGSAGNRRKWGKYNHIINPSTLSSPKEILAIWVAADKAILADAMTTALYFVPAEKLLERYSFDYLILHEDSSIEGSLLGNPMLELFT